jgi:hypothetical protein
VKEKTMASSNITITIDPRDCAETVVRVVREALKEYENRLLARGVDAAGIAPQTADLYRMLERHTYKPMTPAEARQWEDFTASLRGPREGVKPSICGLGVWK